MIAKLRRKRELQILIESQLEDIHSKSQAIDKFYKKLSSVKKRENFPSTASLQDLKRTLKDRQKELNSVKQKIAGVE